MDLQWITGYIESILLEGAVSSEDKTLSMANSIRVYSGHKKSKSERDTKGYMLCTMWRSGRINKPCVF